MFKNCNFCPLQGYEELDNSCNSSTGHVIISIEESNCDDIIEDEIHSTEGIIKPI